MIEATHATTAPIAVRISIDAVCIRSGKELLRRPRWRSSTHPAEKYARSTRKNQHTLQALVTLNDPQFVEAAKKLAESTLQLGPEVAPDETAKIQFIAKRLVGRSFEPNEMTIVLSSLAELRKHYEANLLTQKSSWQWAKLKFLCPKQKNWPHGQCW